MIAVFGSRSLLITLLAGFAFAQDKGGRLPITKDEVCQTIVGDLRVRGVAANELPSSGDIELSAAIPAAEGRELRVIESCWDAKLSRAQFRIECKRTGDCPPFFAYVLGHGRGLSSERIGRACQGSSASPRSHTPRRTVLHAGDRVAVVYQAHRMRVTTVVTCLERGGEGEVIRVRNQDGRIFRARISNATLLEALPQ